MHFEQIPIDVVKRITGEDERQKKTNRTGNVIVEPPAKKTEPYSMPLSSLCWNGR